MIETLVMYVSAQTSVNVLRIAATATTSGINTAGSVPNTNRRITRAPIAPIAVSTITLPPLALPLLLASSSASRPVTLTLIPAGRLLAAAVRSFSAPLVAFSASGPAGYTFMNVVCRSRDTYIELCVEK